MSTILFPSPVFGPVHSRRLGVSLGVNLLPEDGKLCNFDCIYCECGLNKPHRPHERMPSRDDVAQALETRLKAMAAQGRLPDHITFAGNGEPTLHPAFADIVDDVTALRAAYAPNALITVLTNATRLADDTVRAALEKVDQALLKLDTVDAEYVAFVNRPQTRLVPDELVERIRSLGDKALVQTMFLTGTWEGRDVDNTSERYVAPWLAALERIRPKLVTIYTVARATPSDTLQKAAPQVLDAIAERVRSLGLECTVSY